jgi:hypothetical protein
MKTRFLFIVVLFFAISASAFAQPRGEFRLYITGEQTQVGFTDYTAAGISWQFFVTDHIALNYKYTAGWTVDGDYYIHFPALATGILYGAYIDELALLAIMCPEGVSYFTYPRPWLDVEAYLNPLCSDYNIMSNDKISITGTVGIRAHYVPFDEITISPHAGFKVIYGHGIVAPQFGASIGFLF